MFKRGILREDRAGTVQHHVRGSGSESADRGASREETAQVVHGKKDAEPHTAARNLLTFKEIYRSRDGRMSLFADERTGHLAAVDASKLA